jgi:hypothetical protein
MNKKKWIPMIALLAVVVLLGVAFFLLSRSNSAEDTADTSIALSTMESADADRIVYTTSSGLDVALTKTIKEDNSGYGWTLDSDPKLPLDQNTVATVAGDIVGLKAKRQVTDTSQQSDFGFDNPSMTLLVGNGSNTLNFTVGALNSMTSAYYVRNEADGLIYTVASDDLSSVCKTVQDLYAPVSITDIKKDDILVMTLENGNGTLRFTQNDGTWELADDSSFALNQDTVALIANAVCNLKTTWSVTSPGADSEYGLDQPNAVVTLTTTEGKELTCTFGSADPSDSSKSYLRTSDAKDVVYEIDSTTLSSFAYTKDGLAATSESAETATKESTTDYPVQ